jgi:hypothetical protein
VGTGENDDLDQNLAWLVKRYGVKRVAERLSLLALALLRLRPKRAARGRPSIPAYVDIKDEMARQLVKERDARYEQVRPLLGDKANEELIRQIWTKKISYLDIARKVIKEHGQPGFGTAENQAKKLAAEFNYFCLDGPVKTGFGAKWFSDKGKGS